MRGRPVCAGSARAPVELQGGCELAYRRGTPPIFNAGVLQRTVSAINAQLGDVAFDFEPSMGGEDFTLIAQMVPSFRLLVGSSQPGPVGQGA